MEKDSISSGNAGYVYGTAILHADEFQTLIFNSQILNSDSHQRTSPRPRKKSRKKQNQKPINQITIVSIHQSINQPIVKQIASTAAHSKQANHYTETKFHQHALYIRRYFGASPCLLFAHLDRGVSVTRRQSICLDRRSTYGTSEAKSHFVLAQWCGSSQEKGHDCSTNGALQVRGPAP